MKNINITFLLCLLYLFSYEIKAQEINTPFEQEVDSTTSNLQTEDFLNMSIEELLGVRVTTASKNEERIQDAPAIISVVTAKEIENFGALSLSELLDRLTSTYVVGTSFAPYGMLSVRGKQTEHYNTNVLILLDGRPLRESFHGGYNGVIYSMFPISQIERIEIIRGPGSVLYGTNAYVGVVNLITKKGDENALKVTARYGSFNSLQTLVSANEKIKDFDVGFGLDAMQTDGWSFTARGESDVVRNKANTTDSLFKDPTTIKRDNRGLGATFKLGYKGLTVNSFVALNDWATMNRVTEWPKSSDFRIRNNRVLVDLGYSTELSEKWSVSVNSTYNYFDFSSYSSGFQDNLTKRSSSDALLEITNYIRPAKNFNIVLGGLTNMQSGKGFQPDLNVNGQAFDVRNSKNSEPWVTVPKYDVIWNSAYIQMDYTPFKFLKIIGGGQANKIPGFDTDFVPRLATIWYVNKELGAKLLYGQAFRAPTAFERSSLSPPSVYGNQLLTPEKISTYEAQVFFTKSKIDISATYFYSYDGNKISRARVRDTILVNNSKIPFSQKYVNAGYVITQGLELESKLKIGSMINLYASTTYQTSKDNLQRVDYDGMPNLMVKAGILFNYKGKLNTGLYNSYFGTGGDISRYNPNLKKANPKANPYNDFSLNVSANLKKLTKYEKIPEILLHCYITNLLNEEVYYVEVVRRNINSLPGRPGRTINFGLTVNL